MYPLKRLLFLMVYCLVCTTPVQPAESTDDCSRILNHEFSSRTIDRCLPDWVLSNSGFNRQTKQAIYEFLEDNAKTGRLQDRVDELMQTGKWQTFWKKMGSLKDQGESGSKASSVIGMLTMGISWFSEARNDYRPKLEKLFCQYRIKTPSLLACD